MILFDKIENCLLPFVKKPLRYAGAEDNTIVKDHKGKISIVLIYPDLYEIGMSYKGFHILYHILNKMDNAVCERAFVPAEDASELMRETGIPLFSLETRTPLKDFDIIGITLPYELCFTNILEVLDLSRIPFRSKDRDDTYPLILGGGINSLNPEPVADFFDLFLIGDGEEKLPEMINTYQKLKNKNTLKNSVLKELSLQENIYVPSLKTPLTKIKKAVAQLNKENYPEKPVVPLTEITHDRAAVEIMRGCARGCRFCQAGYYYRPVRERSTTDILAQASCQIANSGLKEISLLSLSTSDHTNVEEMLGELYERFFEKDINISFPSMRAESFSQEIAVMAALGRKTTFTFAPEAGSERMRRIINKPIELRTVIDVISMILKLGWKNIKLYYMIGLPFETDEDIIEMAEMINEIGRFTRDHKRVRITASVSPFNPKPHTPFQWAEQISLEKFKHRIGILLSRIRTRNVKLTWRDPEVSVLEAVFSRGDRRLSDIIETAYRKGAKFDAWTEYFDSSLWKSVFKKSGIDTSRYLGAVDPDEKLTWDFIDIGVSKEFLRSEWEKAQNEMLTEHCRKKCSKCGIENDFRCRQLLDKKARSSKMTKVLEKHSVIEEHNANPVPKADIRYRVKFKRLRASRFVSQRNLNKYIERKLFMHSIPIAYSKGYHPMPVMSFGHPLPFGFTSDCEFADIGFKSDYAGSIKEDMKKVFSNIIELVSVKRLQGKYTSLMHFIDYNEFLIEIPDDAPEYFTEMILKFKGRKQLIIQRKRKKKVKEIDIVPFIEKLEFDGDNIVAGISFINGSSVKMSEVFEHIFKITGNNYYKYPVKKTATGKMSEAGLIDPYGE